MLYTILFNIYRYIYIYIYIYIYSYSHIYFSCSHHKQLMVT